MNHPRQWGREWFGDRSTNSARHEMAAANRVCYPSLVLHMLRIPSEENEKMNMRYFAIMLGAFGVFAATSGCIITTETSGQGGGGVGGGDGGSGNTTADGGGGGGVGGGVGGAGGGQGGAGGAPSCVSCGVFITEGGEICAGTSEDLLNALGLCTCGDGMGNGGKCADQCADEACAGNPTDPTGPCGMCITDGANGCGNEFNECANDI